MIGALGGAIGGLIQTGINYLGARGTQAIDMKNQQALIKQQQDFIQKENEIMRAREDNAIQRQAKDMARAGINPLMAGAMGGANASMGGTPGLATAPSLSQAFSGFSSGVASGSQALGNFTKMVSEIKKIDAEVDNIQESTKTNILSRDEMKQRIANLQGEEKLLAEQLLTEIENRKGIVQETLNKQFQRTLMGDEHSLNLKQLKQLDNLLARQDFEKENLWEIEKATAEFQRDLTSEQITQVQTAALKTFAEYEAVKWNNEQIKAFNDMIDEMGLDSDKTFNKVLAWAMRAFGGSFLNSAGSKFGGR